MSVKSKNNDSLCVTSCSGLTEFDCWACALFRNCVSANLNAWRNIRSIYFNIQTMRLTYNIEMKPHDMIYLVKIV